ncbi:MAG: exodeoxyribonuclease VII small subunit [Ruminococcus sp.]|nr:exodeoxyribonuclease VII small subunit [Ruminococcus sp.]
MKYEQSVERLKEIVSKLEDGGLPLDEALDLYKEGVALTVDCKKQLENAKLQVKTASEVGDE